MSTITGQAWTSARTLDQLARHFGYSDAKLEELTAGRLKRATIQGRRAGRKALDAAELEAFADAFGIPTYVLLMEPAEALRWVLDNVPDGGVPMTPIRQHHTPSHLRIQPSPCMREPAAHRRTISPLVVGLPSAA
jgi:hypothetical protein